MLLIEAGEHDAIEALNRLVYEADAEYLTLIGHDGEPSSNSAARRHPLAKLPSLLVLAAVLVACGATHRMHTAKVAGANAGIHEHRRAKARRTNPTVSLPKMLGQMIVASFAGTSPSPSLLARVSGGEVGGVILFADNFAAGLVAARTTIAQLQAAARRGGNPPLLVMTDQEGGTVSRIPGPPTLAASEMSSATVAFAQGRATGRLLRSVGVNVDLAPVADVERVPDSFLGTRSFGSNPSAVAQDACAFARGLAAEGVIYTLKHFPGLGRATQSTDVAPVSIHAGPQVLRADYAAYAACGHGPRAMVMVSNATYPNLTGPLPAVMSPATYQRELPIATGGAPVVTISDDLGAGALTDQNAPAGHAIDAGLDLLLYAGAEQASVVAYTRLLPETRTGLVSGARIRAAYQAIVALKRRAHL